MFENRKEPEESQVLSHKWEEIRSNKWVIREPGKNREVEKGQEINKKRANIYYALMSNDSSNVKKHSHRGFFHLEEWCTFLPAF